VRDPLREHRCVNIEISFFHLEANNERETGEGDMKRVAVIHPAAKARRRLLFQAAAVLLLLASADASRAQSYPAGPVTIVVPTAAGGGMDVTSRLAATKLTDRLGKPFLIENKPGRVTAPSAVASANADGYTLLAAPSASMAAAVALFKALPYNPMDDFVPVALVTKLGFVLVSNPKLPINSFGDLIKHLKANPNSLSYGSAGTGSIGHLATELLKSMAGVEMTHVPYRGTVPAVTDVMAGHVAVTFADPGAVHALIAEGKIRALAVSTSERLPSLPNVPTIAEAGLPGYAMGSWVMMVAPAKTPMPVVNRLNGEFRAIFALPDVKQKIIELGFIPVETPPVDDLRRFVKEQIAIETKIVRDIGLAGSE
jgi:tripartite-type tricarboxylate transporter receptor subunit TctC